MVKGNRIMWLAVCALAGLAVAFGALLSAQAGVGQNSNGNANAGGGNTNGNMGGESGRGSAASADAKFMMTAAQGGLAEVAAGRVALERASSEAVKQFAQKMIDDHTANNEELMQLAAAKGVTLPTAPDAKHRMMLDKMSKLSGAQFDMEYVKNSGVKDHEAMEKLMAGESTKGKDTDARAFAAKTLPVVRMHLSMARDMMSSMKGAGAARGNMNGGTHGSMNSNGGMNSNMNSNMSGNMNSNRKSNSNNSNAGSNSNNSNR